ncbi:MAG: Xaa-Pro peptidase family protein [Lachnospiraceae bacterium]|jgi:Xaa-Pro aminopeptidase|nr:Xaa-Pro peptidase family protein [Lachnospiraceae bacterium]
MNEKLVYLRNKLKTQNIDGMIITNSSNVSYLLGIPSSIEAILLITKKENICITDARYIELINKIITVYDEIVVTNIKDVSKDDFENYFAFHENIGFEEYTLTYMEYKKMMHTYKLNNAVETDKIIEKQRMIKDDDEIQNIKKACEITDNCFKHLTNFIQIGMTEKEIAFEIEKYFKLNGADDISFKPIVASGVNSSVPHAIPTDKKIEEFDIITIDMGCKYNGYCSDMTRTIFVKGVKPEYKAVYDLVLKNQLLTLDEIKDGKSIKSLSQLVENDFKLYGYDLVHSLGHGVGLQIHEMPAVSAKNDTNLKQNEVITSEPGIYVFGRFGVRIEDTVLVGKEGGTALTNTTKDYVII